MNKELFPKKSECELYIKHYYRSTRSTTRSTSPAIRQVSQIVHNESQRTSNLSTSKMDAIQGNITSRKVDPEKKPILATSSSNKSVHIGQIQKIPPNPNKGKSIIGVRSGSAVPGKRKRNVDTPGEKCELSNCTFGKTKEVHIKQLNFPQNILGNDQVSRNSNRQTPTPQQTDTTQSSKKESVKNMVIKLKQSISSKKKKMCVIQKPPLKEATMKRNSSQPFVAINHYYSQNRSAQRSARCSPDTSNASRYIVFKDAEPISHLRILKRNNSKEKPDKNFQATDELQGLLNVMLKSGLKKVQDGENPGDKLVRYKKMNTTSKKISKRQEESKEHGEDSKEKKTEDTSRSGAKSAPKSRLKVKRNSENPGQNTKKLPSKLITAVLNKSHKGAINVSINQNVSNVCYGPVYVNKCKENKKDAAAGEDDDLVPLSQKLDPPLVQEDQLKKITEEPCSFKESEVIEGEEAQPMFKGAKITIRLLDSISKSRERLIAHNINYIQKNKSIPPTTLDAYKFVKLIGKGSFGKVILGIHKLTGKYVAIKAIDKSIMKNSFSRNKVLQEVYILKKIRHANVIRLLEVFEDAMQLLIVMEYAAGGDLLRFLKIKGRLNEDEAKLLFRQIVYGLAHIHSRYVLHRDIKLDNILLDEDGGVKICDFGVSKIYTKGNVINEKCGTPAYIAPEVISGEGYEGYYLDHWSLGIVLFAMLCAAVPFKADNMNELLSVILSTPITFPVPLSPEATDLILNLLVIDPYKRLSLPEILDHPWLANIPDKNDEDVYLTYKDTVNPQALPDTPNINIVNVGNLFFTENPDEVISYTDYCFISNDLYTQHIDDEAIKVCESYGYPRDLVLNSLQNGVLNHATASYNLLVLP